jgi:hypothetical protein
MSIPTSAPDSELVGARDTKKGIARGVGQGLDGVTDGAEVRHVEAGKPVIRLPKERARPQQRRQPQE